MKKAAIEWNPNNPTKILQHELKCSLEDADSKDISKPNQNLDFDKTIETQSNNSTDTIGCNKEPTKLEKQQKAISESIKKRKFNPMQIPDGGKGILKQICESDYSDLFDGDSSFDNAWKKSRSLFRMANHSSYAKRGR